MLFLQVPLQNLPLFLDALGIETSLVSPQAMQQGNGSPRRDRHKSHRQLPTRRMSGLTTPKRAEQSRQPSCILKKRKVTTQACLEQT